MGFFFFCALDFLFYFILVPGKSIVEKVKKYFWAEKYSKSSEPDSCYPYPKLHTNPIKT